MKGNKTEKYIKNSLKPEAPEEVWEKIKDRPILVYSGSQGRKKRKVKPWRGFAAVAAAAAVIAVSAALVNRGDLFYQPVIEESGDEVQSEMGYAAATGDENAVPSDTDSSSPQSSQRDEDGMSMGVAIPYYKVVGHRLYSVVSDTDLTPDDLGDEYTETQNGSEVSVYSIKGVPLRESFAIRANGGIIRYGFTYQGEFLFDGEKYGILDQNAYYYPEPQKGEYLGTVDGMKVYEFKGNSGVILIDLNPIVAIDGDTDEFLYPAEKLG